MSQAQTPPDSWPAVIRTETAGACTYISGPHHPTNLLHRVQVRAQAAVHGEDLLVNDGGNWQAIETVGECFPQLDVVSALAFVVEAIDAVDGRALVVAPEDEEVFRVFDLVCQQ